MDTIVKVYEILEKSEINHDAIKDEDSDTLYEIVRGYEFLADRYLRHMIKNLYTNIIDFIYLNNQNSFIVYTMKCLIIHIQFILKNMIGYDNYPYKSIKEVYKVIIDDSISEITLKSDGSGDILDMKMTREEYLSFKESIINNPELDIVNIIDKDNLITVLMKYTKEENMYMLME